MTKARLEEMDLLVGQAEEITLSTISKNGKPVAVLQRPEPNALQLGAEVRRIGMAGR